MTQLDLMFGARRLVDHVTNVQEGENALVVLDSDTDSAMGEALMTALREKGAKAQLLETERANQRRDRVLPVLRNYLADESRVGGGRHAAAR